jgi:fluoride exporter
MSRLLLVSLGGAIGSGARYLLSTWALAAFGAAFPCGTLAVNAIGSFLMCAIMYLGVSANVIPQTLRLFLTTGIMGGFTTYSPFDYETYRYTQIKMGGNQGAIAGQRHPQGLCEAVHRILREHAGTRTASRTVRAFVLGHVGV